MRYTRPVVPALTRLVSKRPPNGAWVSPFRQPHPKQPARPARTKQPPDAPRPDTASTTPSERVDTRHFAPICHATRLHPTLHRTFSAGKGLRCCDTLLITFTLGGAGAPPTNGIQNVHVRACPKNACLTTPSPETSENTRKHAV